MTSITKQIWKAIDEDITVRRAIENNIASMKNVAVYFIKKHKLNATTDAVISAIRRYQESDNLEKKFEKAREIIGRSEDIKITTNIVLIVLEKNNKTQKVIETIFNIVNFEKGELLLINQGEQSVKIITNEKNKNKILKHIPNENIINLEENIGQINIQLHEEAVNTPGIISVLTTELMMHDINVVENMSCVPEMLFFIKQKDMVKAYDVFFKLCRSSKK
jgi:hypothetical protein